MRSAASVAVPGLPVLVAVFDARVLPGDSRGVGGAGAAPAGLRGGKRAARRREHQGKHEPEQRNFSHARII